MSAVTVPATAAAVCSSLLLLLPAATAAAAAAIVCSYYVTIRLAAMDCYCFRFNKTFSVALALFYVFSCV